MKCAMCSHHWCWTCGLDYYSPLHRATGGGFLCEIIGKISFREFRKCTKVLLLLLLIIFYPLFVAFICLLKGGCLTNALFERCGVFYICDKIAHCLLSSLLARILVRIFLGIPLSTVWLAITLTVAGLLFAVSIVPAYIVLVFLLCRKFYIWNRGR